MVHSLHLFHANILTMPMHTSVPAYPQGALHWLLMHTFPHLTVSPLLPLPTLSFPTPLPPPRQVPFIGC